MQGTSAHLEYVNGNEKCTYSIEGTCYCKTAKEFMNKCVGKSRCKYHNYEAKVIEKEKKDINEYLKLKDNANKKNNRKVITKQEVLNEYEKKNDSLINKTIILESIKTNQFLRIRIVDKKDENPFKKLFSEKSILAKAIIGKEEGQIIRVQLGKNEIEYKILSIE